MSIRYQAYESTSNLVYALEAGPTINSSLGGHAQLSLGHASFSNLRLQFSYYNWRFNFTERDFNLFQQTATSREEEKRLGVFAVGLHYHLYF